jgi:glutamate N-acetyltransferase/amino-acid N-acetyltransferase
MDSELMPRMPRNDKHVTSISPLAPASFPEMPPVDGVRFATAAAGIRYPGRTDVLLAA